MGALEEMNEFINETTTNSDGSSKDDLHTMFIKISQKVNIKIAIILYFVFIVIHSSSFVNDVLAKQGLTEGRYPTNTGILVQGLVLVLVYMILDVLHKGDII